MIDASNSTSELCAFESSSRSLRVRFIWSGDRYAHVIEQQKDDQIQILLESVEGTGADDGPPSPALQSLNVSRIVSDTENRRVAMLVGAAGTNHWSMCVAVCDQSSTPRESPDFPHTELVFDVACRLQQRPAWLGSTYRAMAAPVAVSEKLNCACIPMRRTRRNLRRTVSACKWKHARDPYRFCDAVPSKVRKVQLNLP